MKFSAAKHSDDLAFENDNFSPTFYSNKSFEIVHLTVMMHIRFGFHMVDHNIETFSFRLQP